MRVLPGSVIDHDAVAIINDAERDGFVVEMELGNVGELGVADINRRLVVSHFAGGEGGIERAPVFWIFRAVVAPDEDAIPEHEILRE